MMDDLISRQAAIDAVNDLTKWYYETYHEKRPTAVAVIDKLIDLPSAQPEQKKGKWIVHPEVKNIYGGTFIECSQCGEKYVVQHMKDEKYCRNCGAKMEREQKHLGNKSDLVILDEVTFKGTKMEE